MMWLWVIVLVVIIGSVAVVVAGRNDTMVDVYDDRPDATLPIGRPLTADDMAGVRFSTAVRGYRMDEVDAFVTRVQDDLRARQSDAASDGFDGVVHRGDAGVDELDHRDGEPLDEHDSHDQVAGPHESPRDPPPAPPSGAEAVTPP